MFRIVPNNLRDLIYQKMDSALKRIGSDGIETLPEKDKEILYHQLLDYYDEHGELPEFELEKK